MQKCETAVIMMELWDILDKDGNRTGKTIVRGKKGLKKGEYHLVVHIWIFNQNGDILIQRRSDTRPLMPGEWAATGGSAFSNESSRHAASRELQEELGIKLNRHNLKLIKRMLRRFSITDIWAARVNVDISELTLQKDEVAEAKWVTKEQLNQMVQKGLFHNYGKEYFDLIYSINDLL